MRIATPKFLMFTAIIAMFFAGSIHAQQDQDPDKTWKQLTGDWVCLEVIFEGQALPKTVVEQTTLSMSKGKYVAGTAAGEQKGGLEIDLKADPHQMKIESNLNDKKSIIRAIFKFEKEELILCYSFDETFPTEFKSTAKNKYLQVKYKRAAKKK